ncbi:MAG: YqgE/AlgH family protein [Candidatus Rokubacteria bacterium]|nr:YqgE/AlgH family protein [Candidatus Rokubacteria bacterium]
MPRVALAVVVLGLALAGAAAARDAGGLAGQLLVATDDIRDPRFHRTVIYLVRHDATGALGLVVNRPLGDVPLARVLEQFGAQEREAPGTLRVHYGGPVEPGRAFMLHTADYAGRETQVIKDGVAVTAHPDVLDALARGRGPRRTLFALGYAGWAPGQLEGELGRGAWIVVPADEALVFDDAAARKWDRAMARRKIDL